MARFGSGAGALMMVVLVAAGCVSSPPNDVVQGVGFQDYQDFQTRQSQLRGTPIGPTVVPPTAPAQARVAATATPLHTAPTAPGPAQATATSNALPGPVVVGAGASAAPSVIDRAAAAIAAAERQPAQQVQLAAAPLPTAATASNPDISDEQDFNAVAGRETIESDAERRTRMQAERIVVAPTALPDRPANTGVNVIEFALATTHPLGERLHPRLPRSEARHTRNCRAFRSPDLAQEWFLANGGPSRDARTLDPDGDGYACAWNPEIYRTAAAAARN